MTFAPGDTHPFPVYGCRFRFEIEIYDADGDLVTAAAGLDSRISKNQGTQAACVNEATEIATSSGRYFLDLTAAETTAKSVSGVTRTTTTGAKTAPWKFSVERLPTLESGTAQAGAASTITLASGASAKDDFYKGLLIRCSNNSPANVEGQLRKIISYVGATRVATVDNAWGTNPSVATTYEILIPNVAGLASILGQRVPDWAVAGRLPVDAVAIGGTTQTGRDIGASVLLSPGTGAGQLNVAAGVVDSNLTSILGTALTETAGLIAAGFKKFFNIATPTGTLNSLPAPVPGAAGGLFIAGSNAATTANITGNISGNLTGSVGSVSGSVGSVVGLTPANLDAAVSTRASQASVTVIDDFLDTEILAIKAVTDALPNGGALTTLATAAAVAGVQADTDNIQTRLPAALVSGRIDASVGAMAANVMTAAAAATDLAPELAVAVIDQALVGHTNAGTVGAAINSSAAATDPLSITVPGGYAAGTAGYVLGTIGASADPLTNTVPGTYPVNSAGYIIGNFLNAAVSTRASQTSITTLQADTDDIQSRLPPALVSNKMDVSVSAMQPNVITAAVLASDASTEFSAQFWSLAGAEPVTVPASNATIKDKIDWLFARATNPQQFARETGVHILKNSDGSITLSSRTATDNITTNVRTISQWT